MSEDGNDQNNMIGNEALLRDSLEYSVEEYDNLNNILATGASNMANLSQVDHSEENEMVSQENSDKHRLSSSTGPNELDKDSIVIEREQKPKGGTRKPVIEPKTKNIIETNKMNIRKGPTKNSYSKMHQKKIGKKVPIEKKGEYEINQETNGPSDAATELRKQVLNHILADQKDELNKLVNHKSIGYYHNYAVKETKTNQFSGFCSFENDDYMLESSRSNETQPHNIEYRKEELSTTNIMYPLGVKPNDEYSYMQKNTNGTLGTNIHGAATGFQLPPVCKFPVSVQSAPAHMQEYQDPRYNKSYRSSSLQIKPGESEVDLNSSMTSLASTGSGSEQAGSDSMTYSGIFANAKQNSKTTYKPYSLGDYKRLKNESRPGGLGPDTKSEEHQQKAKKAIRQKEYSVAVKQRNTSENRHSKKKHTPFTKEVPVQKQEANARRTKALEYAKGIPKPVTSRHQNAWRLPSEAEEEPPSLLDILQQRHEDEKKAIDAMRKDLQAKLKAR